jgi:hypothetical protein
MSTYTNSNTITYPRSNIWRKTSAEKRELERLEINLYEDIRRAAEVHRQVRTIVNNTLTFVDFLVNESQLNL